MNPRLQHRLDEICQEARGHSDRDPRQLHDELLSIRATLVTEHTQVPQELRETVEELEAAILEDFYDNLPV